MIAISLPRRLILALLLGAVSGMAAAERLPDPTRPPPGIGVPEGAAGEVSSAGGPPVNRGLQVVIIAPDHRAAIINGQTVRVGEKYGDATLVGIQEGSVMLRDAHGRKVTLSMFPAVGITKKEMPPRADNTVKESTPAEAEEKTAPPAAPQEEK